MVEGCSTVYAPGGGGCTVEEGRDRWSEREVARRHDGLEREDG